jgi:hypothetical protein
MSANQIIYDVNKCFCKKNKFSNEQCSYKKKENSHFCGIHSKAKVKDIFNIFIELGLYIDENDENNQNNGNKKKENKEDINTEEDLVIDIINNSNIDLSYTFEKKEEKGEYNEKIKKIYEDKDSFFEDLFIKNKELSVFTLRSSIKKLNLKVFISPKQSRPELIKELKDIYEKEIYYNNNLNKIIKIQNYVRFWIKNRLSGCINDTDILTFDSIYEIPKELLYIYKNFNSSLKYAYDIRTLIQILNQDKPTCPYTCKEFTIGEKLNFLKDIEKKRKLGIKMEIDKIKLKPEEETEMRMIDVFHKVNLLGNYTSHLWLKNMSINQLIKFYTDFEDLWIYRLGLSQKERRKYVKNGQAFITPVYDVKALKNLNLLRNICLNEIDRFISDGIGLEERKLGAMWMLTTLVDSSFEAAEALPHLVQN